MSRLGWAILAVVVLGLGWYVFRPQPPPPVEWVRVWGGTAAPVAYRLRANGLDQRIAGEAVELAGHRLPLAREVANALWNQLTVLSVQPDRFVPAVPPADVGAYGIDPHQRRVEGEGVDLGWGVRDGQGYVYDWRSQRIAIVGLETAQRLDRLAGRLDAERLVPTAAPLAATVDGLRLVRHNGVWAAITGPMRPAFDARMQDLLRLAGGLRVGDLAATLPADVREAGRARFEYGEAPGGLPRAYDLVLHRRADGSGAVQVNAWPPLAVDAMAAADWLAALAAFREDRPFSILPGLLGDGVERVEVTRGGRRWFELESRSVQELGDSTSRWDVVWEGGREYADPLCAVRLIDAFNGLALAPVRLAFAAETPWTDAVRVRLLGRTIKQDLSLELRGRAVRTPMFTGPALVLPAPLDRLAPDAFLDTLLAGRVPERVRKFQRRYADGRGEVFTRAERGAWARTWPQPGPVDPVAIDRVARAIAMGRARRARFADADDRARAQRPDVELAFRFDPAPAGKANDYVDLDETTTSDLGLALWRAGDGWRALLLDAGVVYELDDQVVEELLQPVEDPLVLPLLPALVEKAIVASGGRTFTLVRRDEAWALAVDGGPERPAVAVEARRLLRDLAALAARRRVAGGALDPDQIAGTLAIELPGMDRAVERLVVQVGRPGAAGAGPDEVALHVESTRSGQVAGGRAIVPAAAAATLLPEARRFATP